MLQQLKDEIYQTIAGAQAKVSLLMKDLDTEEGLLSYEAQRRVVSASTIKVPIMLTALQQVKEGKLALTQKFLVAKPVILQDSEVFERGELFYTLEELLVWMIITSDNTATNVLIHLLGMDTINAYCKELGLSSTVVMREMLDFAAIDAGRNNYTSAFDMQTLFEALYRSTILTPRLCGYATNILLRQRCNDLFMRYICEDIKVAHKTGGLDFLNHDTGVFYLDNINYYLGIFVTDAPDDDYGKRLIGKISKMIYEYYKAG